MNELGERSSEALIHDIDAFHARISDSHRGLLGLIAEADRREVWRDWGARDMAHWLAIRHGLSEWKARRWIAAAHALEGLPRLSRALSSGELGIDKAVELSRFARPETEGKLIAWARGVSCACIRRRADLEASRSIEDARNADRVRSAFWWYYDEGTRFGLQADLPAADGAVIARALDRISEELPLAPGDEVAYRIETRRADALVALASARIANDADPDRATVVVHAPLSSIVSGDGGCELDRGAIVHSEIARRLLCNARVQTIVEDGAGDPIGVGRMSREPSAWMMRQLRYRDHECRFPGCGARRFTQAHHIVWWERGGRTDLDNLVLVCTFHHKLVHEYGWGIGRDADGIVRWLRPDGTPYSVRAGPPREAIPA